MKYTLSLDEMDSPGKHTIDWQRLACNSHDQMMLRMVLVDLTKIGLEARVCHIWELYIP